MSQAFLPMYKVFTWGMGLGGGGETENTLISPLMVNHYDTINRILIF